MTPSSTAARTTSAPPSRSASSALSKTRASPTPSAPASSTACGAASPRPSFAGWSPPSATADLTHSKCRRGTSTPRRRAASAATCSPRPTPTTPRTAHDAAAPACATPTSRGPGAPSVRRVLPLGRWATVPDEGFYRAGRTRSGPHIHGGRAGADRSRRPRWDSDAGITERDVAALVWLGQQYAARSDVLRVLLGRLSPGSPRVAGQLGDETLRQILDRWQDRGLIARDRLLGWLWVAPTARALRLVGLDVRAWSFVIPQLAHVHAVGVVRLALEPSIPEGGRWVSERELRQEAGKSHIPDGAVELPEVPDARGGAGLYGEDVDPLPRR